MIVVDTNIIAYLFIPGEYTESVEKLFAKDSDWHAPYLWRSEFCSVLGGCLRTRKISLSMATKIYESATQLLSRKEHFVNHQDVLHLVNSSECSAYDCEYVALAKKLQVPLVTQDAKINKEFPQIARSLK